MAFPGIWKGNRWITTKFISFWSSEVHQYKTFRPRAIEFLPTRGIDQPDHQIWVYRTYGPTWCEGPLYDLQQKPQLFWAKMRRGNSSFCRLLIAFGTLWAQWGLGHLQQSWFKIQIDCIDQSILFYNIIIIINSNNSSLLMPLLVTWECDTAPCTGDCRLHYWTLDVLRDQRRFSDCTVCCVVHRCLKCNSCHLHIIAIVIKLLESEIC